MACTPAWLLAATTDCSQVYLADPEREQDWQRRIEELRPRDGWEAQPRWEHSSWS